MKTELEQSDIQAIAVEVAKALKPLFKSNGNTGGNNDTIFTVKTLAEYLHVSPKWIYERTHLKEIPYYKVIGQLMFKKKDIDDWLTSYKVNVLSDPPKIRAVKQ